ncbi:GGDEF domain-containing protein [Kibdelosporangium aridum]|uniref:GGDEF domain-containing protein n=1 Tax=Kibdelosporangium aridum TaxID=2030 RepID=A0A428YYE3_KIBAR|nr:GGDEF domain-containing protein [Kibdelosporangium aridum]RSM75353.1 GGDEF domain-containing protein [Kibdelosporangium aridum]
MADQIGRLGVRHWALWQLTNRARIGYVLVIDALAVVGAVIALTLIPVPSANLLPFALLTSCALVYVELSRPIERLRMTRRPFIDLNSVWMFGAILLLHPALAALVITVSYLAQWLRVRPGRLYRKAFSASATIVAGYAANTAFAVLSDAKFQDLPRDIASFGLVVGAGLVFLIFKWAVFYFADAIATPGDYALEASAIALGIMLAWALVDWPIVLLLIIGITLVLHRGVLIRQLRDQARTDPKTGLLNSASWSNDAETQLARGENAALLMLDLDNFKSINDRYGHLVGDKHLKGVADVLRSEVRATDMVGRFGGEEFVILLPGASQEDAMAIAERIRRRVEGFAVEGLGMVTVSVGVAAHPDHGTTLEEVMNAADLALLAAKTAGRNRTLLFAAPST